MSFVKYSVLEVGIVEETPDWVKKATADNSSELPVEDVSAAVETVEDNSKGE